MLYYKNISLATKTFYGVEFKPGEINAVPGFINNSHMMRVNGDAVISATSDVNTESATTRTRSRRKKLKEPVIEEVAESELASAVTSNIQFDLLNNTNEEELENGSN